MYIEAEARNSCRYNGRQHIHICPSSISPSVNQPVVTFVQGVCEIMSAVRVYIVLTHSSPLFIIRFPLDFLTFSFTATPLSSQYNPGQARRLRLGRRDGLLHWDIAPAGPSPVRHPGPFHRFRMYYPASGVSFLRHRYPTSTLHHSPAALRFERPT